jgi:hypothetical protein
LGCAQSLFAAGGTLQVSDASALMLIWIGRAWNKCPKVLLPGRELDAVVSVILESAYAHMRILYASSLLWKGAS